MTEARRPMRSRALARGYGDVAAGEWLSLGMVYAVAVELEAEGEPVDVVTVAAALNDVLGSPGDARRKYLSDHWAVFMDGWG